MHFPIAILRRALIQTALHLEREKSVARTSQENALKAGGDIISRLPRKLDGKHCAKKDLWLKSRATACADNGLTINRPTSPEELPRCLKNKMSRGPEKCLNTALLSDSSSNFPRMRPAFSIHVCGQMYKQAMSPAARGFQTYLERLDAAQALCKARKPVYQCSWFPSQALCCESRHESVSTNVPGSGFQNCCTVLINFLRSPQRPQLGVHSESEEKPQETAPNPKSKMA